MCLNELMRHHLVGAAPPVPKRRKVARLGLSRFIPKSQVFHEYAVDELFTMRGLDFTFRGPVSYMKT
jgi:hypothetical protein